MNYDKQNLSKHVLGTLPREDLNLIVELVLQSGSLKELERSTFSCSAIHCICVSSAVSFHRRLDAWRHSASGSDAGSSGCIRVAWIPKRSPSRWAPASRGCDASGSSSARKAATSRPSATADASGH